MITAPRAQYFGGDLRSQGFGGGLQFSEVDYATERRWAPHTHGRAFFALLLRGRYVESVGRAGLEYMPFDLGFHPASMHHTDQIAVDETRFLLVELDEPWMRRLWECSPQAASSAQICDGRAAALGLRLFRELRAAGPESPSAEGLVLEMLAGLLPRGTARTPPPWLATVLDWIASEYPRKLSLTRLAAQVRLHPVYLSRAFRDHTGRSVSECLTEARIRFAARRLADPEAPLAEIALEAGFADQSHFTKVFKRETGMTPGAYRSGQP